jgi:hypothetical protein
MSKTRAIVNLATGSWYPLGQRRLNASLDNVGFTGLREFYVGEASVGAPLHKDANYVFKAHAVNRTKGDLMLWCDAANWAVKDLEPIWQAIEEDGYVFFQHGHKIGTWTNDLTLQHFGWSRGQAMQREMLSSGIWGVDRSRSVGYTLWEHFYGYRNLFHGAWNNTDGSESPDPRCKGHRHDQSILSILAWEYGCRLRFGQETYAYVRANEPVPETAIFHARGMRGDETEQDWMKV